MNAYVRHVTSEFNATAVNSRLEYASCLPWLRLLFMEFVILQVKPLSVMDADFSLISKSVAIPQNKKKNFIC